MNIPEGLEHVLKVNPEIMHGVICFDGTRIPLTAFLDNLKEGMTLDEFLSDYKTISREQALAVLRWQDNAIRRAAGLQLAG